MSRLLVTGGRKFDNKTWMDRELDEWKAKRGVELIICGAAEGADLLAHGWAMRRGVPSALMPAAWGYYDGGAGPIRNRWMANLLSPTDVLWFPGGNGTADMKAVALQSGLPLWEAGTWQ